MRAKNESVADIFKNKVAVLSHVRGSASESYISIKDADFEKAISLLDEKEFSLTCIFCAEGFEKKGFCLFYVFEKKEFEDILVLVQRPRGAHAPSIAAIFPSACWFERDVSDGFGIEFDNAFDKRRLFLHEPYPESVHPLLKSFKNKNIKVNAGIPEEDEYKFKEVSGEGVYQIPVGPVHAGIIEPGHFRFSVIGETIFNLEIRMFYKHRGIEKLAEGKSPADCVKIAESISGDESVANAVGFCNAVENISKIPVPKRAAYLRTILLEMERIYSHLGDMAGMIIDVAYPVGASPFFILREEIFRQNDALTGSRFMKGIIEIGGMKKDISSELLEGLSAFLNSFSKRFSSAVDGIRSSPSVIDRLDTCGIVKKELVRALNLSGPIARSAGVHIDTRTDHPYGIYGQLDVPKRLLERGDVLSRFELKASETLDSVKIIQKLICSIPKGDVQREHTLKDGYALSIVEAARGQNVQWAYVKNGRVDRYKVRTASFCSWQAIEHAVLGNIVPDFPLINKSMNLSYAGTDL